MANSPPNDKKVFTREATGLVRQIGSFDAFIFNAFSTFPFAIVFTMIFAIGLFPSANIPAAIVISILPALVIGLTYIILSISMPRSGGDYVWIGRILHPVLGFMMNFGLVFYLFTFIAVDVDLFTQAGLGSYFYSIGIAQNNSGALNLSLNAEQRQESGSLRDCHSVDRSVELGGGFWSQDNDVGAKGRLDSCDRGYHRVHLSGLVG